MDSLLFLTKKQLWSYKSTVFRGLKPIKEGINSMNMQFHPIVFVYFGSCAMALIMVYVSRQMPSVRGSRIWGLVMLFCAIWSAGDGIETLMVDLTDKLYMIRISYIGVIGTAVFWSFFITVYSHNDRLLTPKVRIILLILPILTYLSVLTLHLHPYFYKSVELVSIHGISGLSMTYGPIFWAWSVFAYCAIFGSGVLLIQAVLRFPHQFHGQIYLLIIAALMPLISNFLYITGHNFIEPFDPSAPAFVISGLLVGLSFHRYRFLDVVPVAHDLVFKHVNSGVILIDKQDVVFEMNPAAERMTNRLQKEVIGQPVQRLFFEQFNLANGFSNEMKQLCEVKVGAAVYELQQTPLIDNAGKYMGKIVLLYDISALKNSEEKLSVANDLLQKIAATDPLTELFNRRSFFDLAQRELSRAERCPLCFSLILIDLDDFKIVNDTKGHPRGDLVLQELARCLRRYSRGGDLLGRYGGDEFIVLAYEADPHEAKELAERFCQKIPPHLTQLADVDLPLTLSIGIVTYHTEKNITIDILLERADRALYKSKKAGRNQVSAWQAGDADKV